MEKRCRSKIYTSLRATGKGCRFHFGWWHEQNPCRCIYDTALIDEIFLPWMICNVNIAKKVSKTCHCSIYARQ